MNKESFFQELYNLYGPVTRARNCFLYTKKGIRITDLYQENGRAILGWEGGNAFTHFKNVLSRGQTGSFICEDHSRLEKAVSTLLSSNRILYYFSSKIDAVKAAVTFTPDNTSIYMPWNSTNLDYSKVDCVVIQPPLPWTDTVYLLAVNTSLLQADSKPQLQNSITIPFALQTAIARSIYNLIEALKVRQEKDWFIYDPVITKYWERKGPYLYSKVPEDKYDDFVLHCLKLGILINPDAHEKSIIPFGADRGVFSKLKNSPFVFE